jgi:hypothetical protein
LEDQITIVAVATRHEKNRRGRRELALEADLTRGLFCVSPLIRDDEEKMQQTRAFLRENRSSRD